MSANKAFITYRLRFDAGGAKEITIRMGNSFQRHPVGSWKAPVEERVKGSLGRREQSSWTCSHTDIVPGEITSKAAAFRVHWIDVRNGTIDFGHGTSIFPRSSSGFWRYGNKKRSASADFEFGHPNCFGTNLPSENLDFIQVTVTPLFRDGSQGKPVLLKRVKGAAVSSAEAESEPPADPPVVESPIVDSIDESAAAETTTSAAPQLHKQAEQPLPTRLFAIALLLGSLFGFLVFRGHKRGVPTTRLIAASSGVSLVGGGLAWSASMVSFPYWLGFLAAGLLLLALVARTLKPDPT